MSIDQSGTTNDYWEGLSTACHGQITAKSLPPTVSRRRVLSGSPDWSRGFCNQLAGSVEYTSGAVLAVMETEVGQ